MPRALKYNKILLLVLIIIFIIFTSIWLYFDNFVITHDQSLYLVDSVRIYNDMRGSENSITKLFTSQSWNPPAIPFITAVLYHFTGMSPDIAILTISSLFVMILALSTYSICKRINYEKIGVLAVFIVLTYPITDQSVLFPVSSSE